ncbi:FAD-dependent oxidoreductase [Aspergillus stella-maris]|uniref:FAD-dependent oxidoreductase n=1 Tax=Aspergillus stella-maris TaxID=1810926 RepID=UPI003CCCFB9F
MSSDTYRLSADLSADREPLIKPTPSSPRVLVIGAGVTGLVTAWMLLDCGYRVTIISKEWATYGTEQRLTSQISGALWELPPTQCGGVHAVDQAMDAGDLSTVQQWAIESFQVYRAMALRPDLARGFGVSMPICTLFHAYKVAGDEATLRKMGMARRNSPDGFDWGTHLFEKRGANCDAHRGLKDAYEHLAPVVDTDVAMGFLMKLVQDKGADFHTEAIKGILLGQENCLLQYYSADAIVDATGLGAREVAKDDETYPLRGAVLRVINDGSSFPKVTTSLIVTAETNEDGTYEDIAFIVPRNDNILVLGSIEQPHENDLDLTPESPAIKEMRRRCEDLLPCLKNAKLDPEYPIAQGLRPYRNSRIRLERENGGTREGKESRIVHCYGHGGAGWSLAFGTSRACVEIVEEIFGAIVPSTMLHYYTE